MSQPRLVAITGATGFIGRHLVVALSRAGWRVRLLMRRDPAEPARRGIEPEIVAGSLGDLPALERLVEGADAVVHVAGLIKASNRKRFFEVNCEGAAAVADAIDRCAPAAHALLVSSMAAREPQLSDYAASKRAGEDAFLQRLGSRASVLRPPVVYGPGDRETLLFFQLAERRLIPLLGSAQARAAMIHVDDLVALMVAALDAAPNGAVFSAADDRPQGYRWHELLGTAARAVGNPAPRFVRIPQTALGIVAKAGDLAKLFGIASMLSTQKLRELRHEDWSVSLAEMPALPGWSPRFDLERGFAETAAWYRQVGWLAQARPSR
ncbi:NAD-dependent epimerase/dehydratase family protein [soil metagenome]